MEWFCLFFTCKKRNSCLIWRVCSSWTKPLVKVGATKLGPSRRSCKEKPAQVTFVTSRQFLWYLRSFLFLFLLYRMFLVKSFQFQRLSITYHSSCQYSRLVLWIMLKSFNTNATSTLALNLTFLHFPAMFQSFNCSCLFLQTYLRNVEMWNEWNLKIK